MKLLQSLLLSVFFSLSALAHHYEAGDLHIGHPWSRETPPNAQTAAAYLTIDNRGQQDDRLLSAETPAAARVELHEHVHKDGLMSMQQVAEVRIPAGEEVKFAPNGLHLMLFSPSKHYQDGERFPLTLQFARAGKVEVEVVVQKNASPAKGHEHEHHEHEH
ncbi:hypothetical protein AXE65_11355 [Ventosimonas gracilis]|uniref:Copper resistance protein CopZ n=1 Tax=Ventosimonas gracilis TaxID=1680762 RepID=A0A139SWD1_9GAMM|nr:copper chaperone PCu(A)C [Ventosimonas gracilis]KXU38903.1 hypothetical protein AXE65_11355 [Ventosimonas gracilis]